MRSLPPTQTQAQVQQQRERGSGAVGQQLLGHQDPTVYIVHKIYDRISMVYCACVYRVEVTKI